jgi:ribosome-binding protein aMBF1 (putative translation factor)
MPRCERLYSIESEIRCAVTSGAYKETILLLSSYARLLETELQKNSVQRDELAKEMVSTNEFLAWILRMVSTAKAHDATRLAELLSVSLYRSPEANRSRSWQLEG